VWQAENQSATLVVCLYIDAAVILKNGNIWLVYEHFEPKMDIKKWD